MNKYNPNDHDGGEYVLQFLKYSKCKSFTHFLNLTRKKQTEIIKTYLIKQSDTTYANKAHAIWRFLIVNDIQKIPMTDLMEDRPK